MKQTLEEEAVKTKLPAEDVTKVQQKVSDTLRWLDSNALAEKDEFEHQRSELEAVCKPVMSKLYQQSGSQANTSCGPQGTGNGPTVEEVD